MQVLLVEDDRLLAEGIVVALKKSNFSLNWVDTGKAAKLAVQAEAPDLIILDLGLPDIDGIELLRSLRQLKFVIPTLILTARDSTRDKVQGLDAGADDYLAKPFEMDELLARLRALERRVSSASSSIIILHNVLLEADSLVVRVDGAPVDLSRREFMLLKVLMENPNKIQTREMLENKLYSWGEEVSSNAVEVHIHHLRKKLPPGFIETMRGVGYVAKSA